MRDRGRPDPEFVVAELGARSLELRPDLRMDARNPCSPGRHHVRARQWWYLSPRFEVIAEAGRTSHLEIDLIRRDSIGRRMLTLTVVVDAREQRASTSLFR